MQRGRRSTGSSSGEGRSVERAAARRHRPEGSSSSHRVAVRATQAHPATPVVAVAKGRGPGVPQRRLPRL